MGGALSIGARGAEPCDDHGVEDGRVGDSLLDLKVEGSNSKLGRWDHGSDVAEWVGCFRLGGGSLGLCWRRCLLLRVESGTGFLVGGECLCTQEELAAALNAAEPVDAGEVCVGDGVEEGSVHVDAMVGCSNNVLKQYWVN